MKKLESFTESNLNGKLSSNEDLFVGVSETGLILFLYGSLSNSQELTRKGKISWTEDTHEWAFIEDGSDVPSLWFEVPPKIYEKWRESDFDSKVSMEQKEENLKNIFVFGKKNGKSIFYLLEAKLRPKGQR